VAESYGRREEDGMHMLNQPRFSIAQFAVAIAFISGTLITLGAFMAQMRSVQSEVVYIEALMRRHITQYRDEDDALRERLHSLELKVNTLETTP
jgi:hypothetical protein